MTAPARARAVLASLALTACGCAVTATTSEYALYRQTRVLPGVEERLAAADDYLRKYPHGALADDVRARFKREEALYYKSKKDSVAGLASYLRALPSGPHGVEAAGRIGALRTKQGRGEELRVAGLATAARIERAVAAREHLRDEIVGWSPASTSSIPSCSRRPSPRRRAVCSSRGSARSRRRCARSPLGKNASPSVAVAVQARRGAPVPHRRERRRGGAPRRRSRSSWIKTRRAVRCR